MAQQLFKNNLVCELATSVTDTATTFQLKAGHAARFGTITAGDYYLMTLVALDGSNREIYWEVVKVTAADTGSDQITVVREFESGPKRSWPTGTFLSSRLTAATIAYIMANASASVDPETVQDIVAGMAVAGDGMTITYDDAAGTLTFDASIGGGGGANGLIRNSDSTTVVASIYDFQGGTQLLTSTDGGYITDAPGIQFSQNFSAPQSYNFTSPEWGAARIAGVAGWLFLLYPRINNGDNSADWTLYKSADGSTFTVVDTWNIPTQNSDVSLGKANLRATKSGSNILISIGFFETDLKMYKSTDDGVSFSPLTLSGIASVGTGYSPEVRSLVTIGSDVYGMVYFKQVNEVDGYTFSFYTSNGGSTWASATLHSGYYPQQAWAAVCSFDSGVGASPTTLIWATMKSDVSDDHFIGVYVYPGLTEYEALGPSDFGGAYNIADAKSYGFAYLSSNSSAYLSVPDASAVYKFSSMDSSMAYTVIPLVYSGFPASLHPLSCANTLVWDGVGLRVTEVGPGLRILADVMRHIPTEFPTGYSMSMASTYSY